MVSVVSNLCYVLCERARILFEAVTILFAHMQPCLNMTQSYIDALVFSCICRPVGLHSVVMHNSTSSAGLPVTYQWYTNNEFVAAQVLDPSARDQYIRIVHECNGPEQEHDAPLDWSGVGWRGVAWRGVAWRGVARRGVAWRGVAWRGVAWRGVAWRGVAWRGVAWRGVAWRGVAWRGVGWGGVGWGGVGWGGGWGGVEWSGVDLDTSKHTLLPTPEAQEYLHRFW